MKGRSAIVSRMFIHRDLLRVISHARGTPASRSKAATIRPMMIEFEIAPSAVFISAGLFMIAWTFPALISMPMMGGIKIMAKKTMMAER